MKHKIRLNAWGNWNGYTGSHKVAEFGCGLDGEQRAEEWLAAQQGARHSALPALEKRVQLYLNGRPTKRRSTFERELLSIAEGLYAIAVQNRCDVLPKFSEHQADLIELQLLMRSKI